MLPSARLDPLHPPAFQVPGLSGHSTVLIGNTLVTYGGMTGPFQLTPECYALDLASLEWTRLLCTGTVPLARAFHTSVMVGWRMFVFGGLLAVGVEDVHFNRHNVFAHPDAVRLIHHCATAGGGGNAANNDTFVRKALQEQEEAEQRKRRIARNGGSEQAVRKSKEAGDELGGVLSSSLRRPADAVEDLPSLRYVPDCEKRWPRTQQQVEAGSLHILNLSEKECNWITIPAIGFAPIPRAHHSACLFQNHMFIAGGYSVYGTGVLGDPDTHACATLHSLNVDTLVWRRVETSTVPWPARWGCASALAPDGRWFFSSGVNPDPPPLPRRPPPGANANGSPSPTSRFTQQMLALQEQQDPNSPARLAGVSVPTEVDEVYCLDLKRREWSEFVRPQPARTMGPRRALMQAAWTIAGRMYTHGGISSCGNELLGDLLYLDEETGEWVEAQAGGREIPSPRCGHTATVVGVEVFLFGGIVNVGVVPVSMTSWQKGQQGVPGQVTAGRRVNEVYALNMQTMQWRLVRAHASEFLRRNIITPAVVDEALVLDPLPPPPAYSVDEIKRPGSSAYVPPRRALPWDLSEHDVDRRQHDAMRARLPVGGAIETAVEQSVLDARQAEIALSRSKVKDRDDDEPVIMWGEESNKNAVAAARAALTEELSLRVKRLDDFTAAASEGRLVADQLRSFFAKDVAPILRDSTKWRESAALEPQKPRSDPFHDILFSFNKEALAKPVTVDTAALPVLSDALGGSSDGAIASVVDSRARGDGPALVGGRRLVQLVGAKHAVAEDDDRLMELDRPWSELTPQQQVAFHSAQLHHPGMGNRYISKSLRRLGLEKHLRIVRGDEPIVEDAKEKMAAYLASRTASRNAYTALKSGKGKDGKAQ